MKITMVKKIGIVFLSLFISLMVNCQWKNLPLRSQAEFNANAVGGEAEQYFHGFSRCFSQPNFIYGAQDVCGSWRSEDGGKSWKKNLDKGLFLAYTTSIEVDPINPKILMIAVDESSMWVKTVWSQEGIYKSLDGGNSWKLVLNNKQDFVNSSQRKLRHLLDYSLPSMVNSSNSPSRWYSADSTALYRSDAAGDSATWLKTTTFPWINNSNPSASYSVVLSVNAHPTLVDVVYVATQTGLYKSTNAGVTLTPISTFSGKYITNVLMNSKIPGIIYVSVKDDGLYRSDNDGLTFSKMVVTIGTKEISTLIQRAFMNPGFPEQIYLVAGGYPFSCITNNSGISWTSLPYAASFPGFEREQSWRLALIDLFTGICPNPQDKNQASVANVASLWEITNAASTPVIKESATGFTGAGTGLNDTQIAFNPNDASNYGVFCFDVGPRVTTSNGDWFQTDPNLNNNWRPSSKISWAGSYSAAYQPLAGSKVVVASIGRYFSDVQLMRSNDGGLTWGAAPVIPYSSTNKQAFNFIGFDSENPNNVYSGNLRSTDAGLTFSPIVFPAQWYETVNGTPNVSPVVLGISHEVTTKTTAVFAVDGFGTQILRSTDGGTTWINFFNIGTSLTSSIKFLDSTPTFMVHPTNINVVYTLASNHDLVKITYNPSKPLLSKVNNMYVFNALPNYVPSSVKAYIQIRRIAIDPVDPNVIYVGFSGSGFPTVYRTTDGGTTWASISDDLTHHSGMVVVNPHTREVFFGSMAGTYMYPAPITGIEIPKVNSNLKVYIDQSSKRLTLLGSADTDNFTISDITGKSVLQFKGSNISLNNLSSGIYIITSKNHVPQKFVNY